MRRARSTRDASACFFMSYARDDEAYAVRLATHLRLSDLPVWFDADLAWGEVFSKEIAQRVRGALAVIVLMSPAAELSDWVEREILEGQRYDRQFLPILLRGERHFLLASSHYFDARGGALPGDREIRQLKAMRDKDPTGAGDGPPITLAPPLRRPAATSPASPEVSLLKLRSFLADGLLANADIVTTAIILKAAGRLAEGWMRLDDGASVPFDLLDQIDAAWSRFTRGDQGFRAQLSRRPADGGDFVRQGVSVWHDFSVVASTLGWKRVEGGTVPRYGEFTDFVEYSPGYFPTLRNPQLERHDAWYDRWMRTVMSVHLRLREWGI